MPPEAGPAAAFPPAFAHARFCGPDIRRNICRGVSSCRSGCSSRLCAIRETRSQAWRRWRFRIATSGLGGFRGLPINQSGRQMS